MQSSQLVHISVITECMRLVAPTIASTGQAPIHFLQPMHSSSLTTACLFFIVGP